jgi:SAM-dependent methyltransferase
MKDILKTKIRCLYCHLAELEYNSDFIQCKNCLSQFPVVRGQPILLKDDNEVFPISAYLADPEKTESKQKSLLSKIIPNPSVNINFSQNLQKFAEELATFSSAYVLVVGSGQQKAILERLLAKYSYIQLIYCDIDLNATVDLFCDAHELPFRNGVFQGILTTAVLEHVLYPERVVSEISRVLENGGVIYSEIPFMQQVHEGAYDFTRYSLSGHRRLLNDFCELSSGLVAGPGTVLAWSIEHFALCFAWNSSSRLLIKALVRLLFSWFKYFDYFFHNSSQAMDGASCTYFLGKKDLSKKTSNQEIIQRYIGADYIRHV